MSFDASQEGSRSLYFFRAFYATHVPRTLDLKPNVVTEIQEDRGWVDRFQDHAKNRYKVPDGLVIGPAPQIFLLCTRPESKGFNR